MCKYTDKKITVVVVVIKQTLMKILLSLMEDLIMPTFYMYIDKNHWKMCKPTLITVSFKNFISTSKIWKNFKKLVKMQCLT